MTLEDARNIGVLIGSKGSLDLMEGAGKKEDIFHKEGCHKQPNGPVKQLFKADSHDSRIGTFVTFSFHLVKQIFKA